MPRPRGNQARLSNSSRLMRSSNRLRVTRRRQHALTEPPARQQVQATANVPPAMLRTLQQQLRTPRVLTGLQAVSQRLRRRPRTRLKLQMGLKMGAALRCHKSLMRWLDSACPAL